MRNSAEFAAQLTSYTPKENPRSKSEVPEEIVRIQPGTAKQFVNSVYVPPKLIHEKSDRKPETPKLEQIIMTNFTSKLFNGKKCSNRKLTYSNLFDRKQISVENNLRVSYDEKQIKKQIKRLNDQSLIPEINE